MKQLVTICTILIAMTSVAQTSMSEYNYLTKGYALDLETGRDLKSGYKLELLTTPFSQRANDGPLAPVRQVTALKFIDESRNKPVAILLKMERVDTKNIIYVCVPDKRSVETVKRKATTDFFSLCPNENEEAFIAYHYFWLSLQVLAETSLN